MDKKLLGIRNIGVFSIVGMIFGGLFGYLCMVYYLIFIDSYLRIPHKFYPIKSFLLLVFIFVMMILFGYLGNCLDDESRAVKEFKNFKIMTISIIVGTIIYSAMLLIIVLVSGDVILTYNPNTINGITWIGGMIIILCTYLFIKKRFYSTQNQ
ncbi:conserved hypothetical protein [Methanocaldococcus sp. FS406-22]|uniref:hypothetical protein n=1 Tax=Methanocaldococcus sp. (strain FS406-22) TaxID=644281 RepID=UPI0001BF432D|nr:hypothetical protein [Methanocaldococcus sp. FS406-22]ADC70312.1 conserved hypothetical protein [Methanocaldococcus sp. FS406-22]